MEYLQELDWGALRDLPLTETYMQQVRRRDASTPTAQDIREIILSNSLATFDDHYVDMHALIQEGSFLDLSSIQRLPAQLSAYAASLRRDLQENIPAWISHYGADFNLGFREGRVTIVTSWFALRLLHYLYMDDDSYNELRGLLMYQDVMRAFKYDKEAGVPAYRAWSEVLQTVLKSGDFADTYELFPELVERGEVFIGVRRVDGDLRNFGGSYLSGGDRWLPLSSVPALLTYQPCTVKLHTPFGQRFLGRLLHMRLNET